MATKSVQLTKAMVELDTSSCGLVPASLGSTIRRILQTRRSQNNPPKHVESIRVYGDMILRLCTDGPGSCSEYVRVRQREIEDLYAENDLDYFGPNDEITGITTYETGSGSVFATTLANLSNEGEYFVWSMADHTGDFGPTSKKNYRMRWDEDYGGYSWPAGCWDDCSSPTGTRDCPAGACGDVCGDAIREYMGMFTYEEAQWVGDASLVVVDSHGEWYHHETNLDVAKLFVMDPAIAYCDESGATRKESAVWYSRDWYPTTDPDHDHQYGEVNTDWLLVTGCDSMGTDSEDLADLWEGWYVVLKSGVHGVGGFRNSSGWYSGEEYKDDGEALAQDLWDAFDTMPVSVAWRDVTFRDGDRDPWFITQEDCDCEDLRGCDSRMLEDYYWNRQSGPMDDLHDSEVTAYCVGWVE